MPLIIPSNSISAGGYEVDNSLRFNSGSSDYITRTPASASNREKWTLSLWVKRTNLSANDMLFYAHGGGSLVNLAFNGTDTLYMDIGGIGRMFETNAVFRDVSAWYHFVIAFNTTDYSTVAAGQVKVYVNGVEQTFLSTTNMSLGYDSAVNNTTDHTFGRDEGTDSNYANFYLSEINLIDGQQLTPSDFGEFDEDSGIWKPIAYEGTYGTNGFYLEFKDSSALGDDTSGNGNDFTVYNLTSIDQTTDTPTNNFCTMNSLDKHASLTPTEGNLAVSNGTTTYMPIKSTFAVSTGAWYCETKITSGSENIIAVYLSRLDGSSQTSMDSQRIYYNTSFSGGTIVAQGVFTYSQGSVGTATTNDIIGIELDVTGGTLKFYKNGTQVGSTVTNVAISSNEWQFGTQLYQGGVSWNFGNAPYTISSGNSDANGYGNFEYAVPSGYYALNTKNLAEYG
jgi:hypothetical protein